MNESRVMLAGSASGTCVYVWKESALGMTGKVVIQDAEVSFRADVYLLI